MTSTITGRKNVELRLIADGIAISDDPPTSWRSLRTLPLVILVGVTGVGKSTLLQSIGNATIPLSILPDRRLLTDELLIPQVQIDGGIEVEPVTDRVQRFEYTRRYRERYAGGMAHALTLLAVASEKPPAMYVFDGLRGIDEVRYAASALPMARFVALHAPDIIRIQRLLRRQDTFDQTSHAPGVDRVQNRASGLAVALPEAVEFFTPAQLKEMEGWIESGSVSRDEVAAKLQIVISERRNYDPDAANAFLGKHIPDRSLILDTQQMLPSAIAGCVFSWIRK